MGPRVVSLAPSATTTIHALDRPDVLIEPSIGPTGGEGAGWLTPDLEAVCAAAPDVVITTDGLQDQIASELREMELNVVHCFPRTLRDVFDYVAEIARAINEPAAGTELASSMKKRVSAIARAVDNQERPIVYCEEWYEPPMAAGNWVPEAIHQAGGQYPFVSPGDRSQPIDRKTIEQVNPDHIIVHHCGQGEATSPAIITDRGWDVTAIHENKITIVDDSLLNQPSPHLITGIEHIATVLHDMNITPSLEPLRTN